LDKEVFGERVAQERGGAGRQCAAEPGRDDDRAEEQGERVRTGEHGAGGDPQARGRRNRYKRNNPAQSSSPAKRGDLRLRRRKMMSPFALQDPSAGGGPGARAR